MDFGSLFTPMVYFIITAMVQIVCVLLVLTSLFAKNCPFKKRGFWTKEGQKRGKKGRPRKKGQFGNYVPTYDLQMLPVIHDLSNYAVYQKRRSAKM